MKKSFHVLFIGCLLLFTSCLVSNKIVYVNDMVPDSAYRVAEVPALRLQKSDRLSIVVISELPELALPFNQGMANRSVSSPGEASFSAPAVSEREGYWVDDNGEIAFPILGTLKVEGLTLLEVKKLVSDRLKEERLINDPVVHVELLNLKINMMGEVTGKGVLNVPDARITLLEAISRAGGLTKNAATDRITVIREEHGERKMFVNNIETIAIFDSPTYYLKQNDIVYVGPRDSELSVKEQNTWRYITTSLGLVGALFSILTFLK